MGRLFDILATPLAVLGVLFVVVAVNVFLYVGYSSNTPTPLPAEHTGPSTTIEMMERKNGKIAFQSDRGGSYEIYTMNRNGNKIDKLTTNTTEDEDPAFTNDRDGDSDIYKMTVRGRRLVRLTTDPATTFGADWGVRWTP